MPDAPGNGANLEIPMGWTTFYSHTTLAAVHAYARGDGLEPYNLVESGSTTYGRHLWTSAERDGQVSACLWLISPDRECWAHKAVGEVMGPYHLDIPLKVWDTLTPTTDKHALNWRARVRHARLIAGPAGPRPATVRRWVKRTGYSVEVLENAATFTALVLGQPLEELSGFAVGLENTGLLGPGLHPDRTVRAFGDFLLNLSASIA
jgi:hypothetical protein